MCGPIPKSLANISSLIIFSFESNDLKDNLPQSLGQLFNLESLYIVDNSLTGFVFETNLMSLSKLKHFSVSSPNLFQLLPVWLGYLGFHGYLHKFLSRFYVSKTQLLQPPDKFWNFHTQIEFLSLSNNLNQWGHVKCVANLQNCSVEFQ